MTERAVDRGRVTAGQYAALLIDEAHDFEDAWLRMAARMAAPETQSLLVLYDDAQSPHQKARRKFNVARVGIDARGRIRILKINHRNTAEVPALAMQCSQNRLHCDGTLRGDDQMQPVEPSSAGRCRLFLAGARDGA